MISFSYTKSEGCNSLKRVSSFNKWIINNNVNISPSEKDASQTIEKIRIEIVKKQTPIIATKFIIFFKKIYLGTILIFYKSVCIMLI
jgi:hypothetical protein